MITLNQKEAESLRDQGNTIFKTGKFNEAIEIYTRSLAYQVTPIVLCNRAMAYLKIKDFKNALNDSNECIKMDESFTKALYRKAQAFRGLNKYRKAQEYLKYFLKKEPENKEVLKELEELGQLAGSQEEVSDEDNKNEKAVGEKGKKTQRKEFVLEEEPYFDYAESSFMKNEIFFNHIINKSASKIENFKLRKNKITELIKHNKDLEAITDINELIDDINEIIYMLASGDNTEIEELTKLKSQLYSNLGLCAKRNNEHGKSIEYCTNAIRLANENEKLFLVKNLFRRGDSYEKIGENLLAMADYSSGYQIDPSDKDCIKALDRIKSLAKAKAPNTTQNASTQKPSNKLEQPDSNNSEIKIGTDSSSMNEILLKATDEFFKKKEYYKAAEAASKLCESISKDPRVKYEPLKASYEKGLKIRAYCYEKLGRTIDSIKDYETLLQMECSNNDMILKKKNSLLQSIDTIQAEEYSENKILNIQTRFLAESNQESMTTDNANPASVSRDANPQSTSSNGVSEPEIKNETQSEFPATRLVASNFEVPRKRENFENSIMKLRESKSELYKYLQEVPIEKFKEFYENTDLEGENLSIILSCLTEYGRKEDRFFIELLESIPDLKNSCFSLKFLTGNEKKELRKCIQTQYQGLSQEAALLKKYGL